MKIEKSVQTKLNNNRTIRIRLVGGLGNQLYQFSFAYYIFKKFNYKKLYLDFDSLKNYKEVWGNLLFDVIDTYDLREYVIDEPFILSRLRLPKISFLSPKLNFKLGLLSEKNYFLVDHNNLPTTNLILDGYFEKSVFRNEYKDLLKPLLKKSLLRSVDENIVIVNVRGGEFKRLGTSSKKDLCFYEDGINLFRNKISNPSFHLITDDLDFAEFLFDGFEIFDVVHKPDPLENFSLLLSAKNKILSKSTFSKWAGFLSEKSSEIIWMEDF